MIPDSYAIKQTYEQVNISSLEWTSMEYLF